MAKYRKLLPQLSDKLFLTDGGMETTLIFHEDIDLPYFASFDLLKTKSGEEKISDYFRRYAEIATHNGVGFILESPTWRASKGWGRRLGYSEVALDAINEQAIEMLEEVRNGYENVDSPMVISGCVGPRDDAYDPEVFMSIEEAEDYHSKQIETFSRTSADMVTALTMTYIEEAIGIVRASLKNGLPVAISFTVETDGRLPSGMTLKEAIEKVDRETAAAPVYYMINCAHPTHFKDALDSDGAWLKRIRGLRANASCKSHAELDEAIELDDGDPVELGEQYRSFKMNLQQLNVMGGCCGTDHRHVEAICKAALAT